MTNTNETPYHIGDRVIFLDEYDQEQTSTIIDIDEVKGRPMLFIEGSYGSYRRRPEDVRRSEENI